jgi:hypothetical protein
MKPSPHSNVDADPSDLPMAQRFDHPGEHASRMVSDAGDNISRPHRQLTWYLDGALPDVRSAEFRLVSDWRGGVLCLCSPTMTWSSWHRGITWSSMAPASPSRRSVLDFNVSNFGNGDEAPADRTNPAMLHREPLRHLGNGV